MIMIHIILNPMNSKIVIIAVVAIAVVVVAAIAVGMQNDEETGIVYHGNGGHLSDGDEKYSVSSDHATNCLFSSEGKAFKSWNTKPDGSGTTYKTGDKVDYTGSIDLYAQWGWAFNYNGDFGIMSGLTYYLIEDNTPVKIDVATMPLPDSGKCAMMIDGGSNWTVDGDVLKCMKGKSTITLTIEIEGATDHEIGISNDEPIIAFMYDGPVTVSISETISTITTE